MDEKTKSSLVGWSVAGACFCVNFCASGAVVFSFTALFQPVIREFGWSYSQVSFAASLRGLETGFLAPVAGLLIARLGPQTLVMAGTLCIGFGLMILGSVRSLAEFYGAFALVSLGLGLATGVVPMTAVTWWFRKKAGLALGIATCGTALGGLMVPAVTALIDSLGWRHAMLYFGAAIAVCCLPVSLFIRREPEKYGYLPDGEVAADQFRTSGEERRAARLKSPGFGSRQILTNRSFWLFGIVLTISLLAVTAVMTHLMPYLQSVGVRRSHASLLAAAVPVCTAVGRFGFGWLADRLDRWSLVVVSIGMTTLGVAVLGGLPGLGMWLLLPFIALFGIGYGGNVTMTALGVGITFEGEQFGPALGYTMGLMTFGQMLAAPLAGWVFDTWGSYLIAWFGLAALMLASIPLLFLMERRGVRDRGRVRV